MSWKDNFPKENVYFETENGILYNGDSLEILKEFPQKSIDLVVTDPPYYKILKEKWDQMWDSKEDYLLWYEKWIKKLLKLINEKSSLYVWLPAVTKKSDIAIDIYLLLKKYFIFQTWIVWRRQFTHGNSLWLQSQELCFHFSKTKQIIQNPFRVESDKFEKVSNRCSNVWYIKDVTQQGYFSNEEYVGHPSQKPIEAIRRIIKGSSNKNNLILDPFIGSGTTAIACEKLNRRWIGIEISKEYCEIVKKRLNKEIGRSFNKVKKKLF